MELSHDWRGFQDVFYPHRRTPGPTLAGPKPSPVFVVVDAGTVVTAFCESEDLSSWVGASVTEVSQQCKNRELIAFERGKVDQWIESSLALPNFHDQVEKIRAEAKPAQGKAPEFAKHFLLEALTGWWSKVLPSSYGLFIRAEGDAKNPGRDFVVIVRRGQIEKFFTPDLHSLGPYRKGEPADIMRFLAEKHSVPMQGIFVQASNWQEWARNTNPWKEVAASIRSNKTKLVPFRWSLATMSATKAFFKV